MESLSHTLRRNVAVARHRAKHFLGRHPALYYAVFGRRASYRSLIVSEDTDICIEGFPRSANSFAVGAFEFAQPQPVRIAHHNHVPAQIVRACRRGIPTLALIRPPVDTIVSGRALSLEIGVVNGSSSPKPKLRYRDVLQSWISFYERILPLQDWYVVGRFEDVIQRYDTVIEQVNERFGTDFALFEHTEPNVQEVNSRRGYHAGPSERRRALKEKARRQLEEEMVPTLRALLDEAEELYNMFAQMAAAPVV